MPAPPIPEPRTRIPDLIVFDLGRVLLRIADDWGHCAKLAGLPLPAVLGGDISAAHTRDHADADHELEAAFADFECGRTSIDDFFAFAAPRLQLTVAQARTLFDGWLLEPMPGLDDLLNDLDHAKQHHPNLRTACLSNTNAAHWEHLTGQTRHPAALPLHRLDFPLASQLLGHAKPNPACYVAFEARAATSGGSILFFDDLPDNVDAARAHGWTSILVPRTDNAIPFLRDALVTHGVL